MNLGYRLAQLRSDQGLTQSGLARAIGTSQSAIAQIEAGDRNPSYDMIRKLADALGVTASYLMGAEVEELTADEQVHFREYKGLSDEARKELKQFMAYLKDKQRKRREGG